MSKWKYLDDKIAALIKTEESDVKIAQQLLNTTDACNKNTDVDTLRTYVKRYRAKTLPTQHTTAFDEFKTDTTSTTANYNTGTSFLPSAWSRELNRFYTIEEFCDVYGLDKTTVKSSKLITHNAANITYNIVFYTPEEERLIDIEKSLESIVSKHIRKVDFKPVNTDAVNEDEWFDRLVYTDAHCGADVQGSGNPLYDGKWDREEFLHRLEIMISHVKKYQRSKLLVIDDLADFLDGYNGETTRGGHKLPQNMTNQEVFDLGLEFKVRLVEALIDDYEMIICNNVTNDNHAGSFGYFVVSASKRILETKYPGKVQVRNMLRFIEHYSIGKHTFLLTHGKDSELMFSAFKPKLDPAQIEKIDQYLKEHKLYNGNIIELSKGNDHIALYDDSTSNDFQYYNYPAFSPPTSWVKINFKNSMSGFRFYNIEKYGQIKIAIPYNF